ncbi:MAG: lipase family protein [Thermoanaerobaculia bacterium]
MVQNPSPNWSIQQVMMTLSAMAYAPPDGIAGFLADPQYATENAWKLVWGPGTTEANLMYVVKNVSANMYAVAIRGTVLSFSLAGILNLYEDLDAGTQVPWQYPPGPGELIANGTQFGLQSLASMTPGNTTLLSFLRTIPAGSVVFVTGHSLGGCLTTVLAPWLQYQFTQGNQKATVVPITFAAPTAGNPGFVKFYDSAFAEGASRYYNAIDLVPMAWSSLPDIKNLYNAPGPPCPDLVRSVVDLVVGWLTEKDKVTYAQTNGTVVALPGAPAATTDWYMEVSTQHDHNTYLSLLGAPPVTIPSVTPESRLRPVRRDLLHVKGGLAA